MRKKLTKNEAKVLQFIYDRDGSPTYREITTEACLADVSSAVYVVNSLIKKNLLKKTQDRSSRALKITEDGYLQLQHVFVGDLKEWLEKEKIKISLLGELKVSGVSTRQQLNTSSNYLQDRNTDTDSTRVQDMPDDIKSAGNLLLSHFLTNGTTENFLNAERGRRLLPLLYSNGMLPTFCRALVISTIILPASVSALGEDWFVGFVIASFFWILSEILYIKR